MIDFFKTWLPQVIGYAELVANGTLRRSWESADQSETSAYYSGELYEQIFGDLDADAMQQEMRQRLKDQPAVIEAVDAFLVGMRELDTWIEATVDTDAWGRGDGAPSNVAAIFQSAPWNETTSRAENLLAVASQAGLTAR